MKHLFPSSAVLSCLALVIAPAFAHHAVSAKFNTEERITLNGPVTQIDWSAPHAHLFVNVEVNDTVLNWAVELKSPTELARAGWSPNSMEVGTVVTVEGPPARDGTRQAWADSVVVDATGNQVFTGRSTDPELGTDTRPAPRWDDGQIRLSPDEGGQGFWAMPTANALVQSGVDVDMDDYGLLASIDDAGEVAPLQPWALSLYQERQRNFLRDDPMYLRCLVPGGPRQFMTPHGVQFIEERHRDRIFVLLGSGNHNWRIIYLDGREQIGDQAGDADNPLYYGRSVGHWEEDTLVVDTRGFNERFWMSNGGLPHTDRLHLVERFTRTDYDTLRYEVTIDDPAAYTRTWESSWDLKLARNERLPEYYCEENRP